MTKKTYTYEDWDSGKMKPFEYMNCGNCLTEHVACGCDKHPKVAQAVLDAVGPLPPLGRFTVGFSKARTEAFLNANISAFKRLHRRFAKYYRRAS